MRQPCKQKAPRGALFELLIFRFQLERAMRFELTTLTLARLCSTPELRPHRLDERGCIKTGVRPQEGKCMAGEKLSRGMVAAGAGGARGWAAGVCVVTWSEYPVSEGLKPDDGG